MLIIKLKLSHRGQADLPPSHIRRQPETEVFSKPPSIPQCTVQPYLSVRDSSIPGAQCQPRSLMTAMSLCPVALVVSVPSPSPTPPLIKSPLKNRTSGCRQDRLEETAYVRKGGLPSLPLAMCFLSRHEERNWVLSSECSEVRLLPVEFRAGP